MKINLIAFGIARDIVGGPSKVVDVKSPITAGELLSWLKTTYPDFQQLRSFKLAVNEDYVAEDYEIQASDEIVLIPPVSGG